MGDKTHISWTHTVDPVTGDTTPGATWDPIRFRVKANAAEIARDKGYVSLIHAAEKMAGHVGPWCQKISPECDNCYAETYTLRGLPGNGIGMPYDRRVLDLIEPYIDEGMLTMPLRWQKPRKIFSCSMTDLFGEWVTDEMLDRIFEVMIKADRHILQILTKRADRLFQYVSARRDAGWRHIWLGVSGGTQKTVDHNMPDLLKTPAAIRMLSAEPLLERIDIRQYKELDVVLIGGESGAGARPCGISWMIDLIAQSREIGAKPFVKQLGAVPMMSERDWRERDPTLLLSANNAHRVPRNFVPLANFNRKGDDPEYWIPELRVQELPA